MEKRNLAITKLFIKHASTGIYGRVLLHLNRGTNKQSTATEESEKHLQSKLRTFSPGDIVGLFQSDRHQGSNTTESGRAEGIVYKVSDEELTIAFNEMHDFENMKQPLSAVLLANEITYKRCKMALD